MKALLSILLLLPSCIVYEHTAQSKSGNVETDKLYSFGGTSSQRGADGSSLVHDHQVSARDFFSAVGTAVGAGVAAHVNVANTSSNNVNATAQAANARVPTVTQPASIAPGTTVFPIVTPPPPPVIPLK